MNKIIIKRIFLIILIMLTVSITPGCSDSSNNNNVSTKQNKYSISNLSSLYIGDEAVELLYDRAKNAAFAWIDSLNEEDYLSIEWCKLTVFSDNSAALLLQTIDKPDVSDDSVLVTFSYGNGEWKRVDIIYNGKKYSK